MPPVKDFFEEPTRKADYPPVNYKDLYFRIILSVAAAQFIISFGEPETFFQMLHFPTYYKSLIGCTLIAFILVNFVYLVTVRLDRRYDWGKDTTARIWLQLILALSLPLIAAYLLANIYFIYFGLDIQKTLYLKYDYPVIVVLILMLNLYYVTRYFQIKHSQVKETINVLANNPANEPEKETQETFMLGKGPKSIIFSVDAISYIFRKGNFNFIRNTNGEDLLVAYTLDEVEQMLPDHYFFRANRKMIVNRKACDYFEPMEYNKLQLVVKPPFQEEIVISQKRSRSFKEWISSN